MTKSSIFERSLGRWGLNAQLDISVEECAELIQAISKIKRFGESEERIKRLISEIADVKIMCEQLAYIYGKDNVEEEVANKLKRLENRLLD